MMKRVTRATTLLLGLLPLVVAAQALPPDIMCSSIGQSDPVRVGQLVLVEAPDLPKELRVVLALLEQRGCWANALARLERYREEYPKDFRISAVDARLMRSRGDMDSAVRMMSEVVRLRPGFASGQVQMGSMMIHFGQLEEARKHLAAAAALAPNDLWMNLHRLRLYARLNPSEPRFANGLMAFANTAELPGDVREVAALDVGNFLPQVDVAVRERAHRIQLTFDSATPHFMKAVNLARHLIEEEGRFEEGRSILRPIVEAHDYEFGKVILAESFLLEAARIDPAPSRRNSSLVAKAKAALNGDLSPLLARFTALEELAHLKPFLLGGKLAHPDVPNQYGESALCNAVRNLDLEGLKFALAAGSNPAALCNGRSPLRGLVARPSAPWDAKRNLLAELLKAGMDPDAPLEPGERHSAASFCKEESEACQRELLPVMAEYRRKGASAGPPGDRGESALCQAIHKLDVEAVKVELGAGFDLAHTCNGWNPLGWVIRMRDAPWDVKKTIVNLLLQAGVDPGLPVSANTTNTAIDFCRQSSVECQRELLPALQAYKRKT